MQQIGGARSNASVVGDRIAAARRQRGMSRKTLADLIGRSDEWLRQIENGQRRLDSIDCAVRLSEILRTADLMTLLGLRDDEAPTAVSHASIVAPVREAMMDAVGADVFACAPACQEAARTLDVDVAEAWRCWSSRSNRYQRTLRLLPGLLRGAAERLRRETSVDRLDPALTAYHLARTVLSRMGEEQLAWIAADRALAAAIDLGGTELLAAAWHTSGCYLRQGYFRESCRLALAAVGDPEPGAEPPPHVLALFGALRLMAAEAAAGMLEAHRAHELLEQARSTARAMADDPTPHRIPFGVTEVGICAVQVAIRLGRAGEAIRLASEVDVPDEYPPDRQARHYVPLAYLHARRNEDAAAVFALSKVAEVSPEDVRYDQLSQQALHRLLRRNNLTVRRELSHLVRLAGIH